MIAWKSPIFLHVRMIQDSIWPTGFLKFLHNIRKNRGDLTVKGSEKGVIRLATENNKALKDPFYCAAPAA